MLKNESFEIKDKDTGDNERGCVTSSSEYSVCGHNNQTCQLCNAAETHACNMIEFPSDRRKCIRCDSTTDRCPTHAQLSLETIYSVYCRNTTDACVVINRETDNFMQTCASEMSDTTKTYCNNNKNKCSFCYENNCNLGKNAATSEPTTEAQTTNAPSTDNPTTEPVYSTEISTKQPSNANLSAGNKFLLGIFIIVPFIMA